MYYKISPVIIGILIVVFVAVAGFGVKFFIDKSSSDNNVSENEDTSTITPTLDLSANTNEENQEIVTITAVASTEDEAGIYSITLPDGAVSRSDNATYNVSENGTYTFKAKGNNGQTTSLTIEVNNIREASASSPYIPTGFSHTEGDVDTGYVIQDSYGNEYVWVPVENGKLTRNTMLDNDYEESNSSATGLVNSVAQNYGFYIGRYEASECEVNGQRVAGSMGNKSPWNGVIYTTAMETSNQSASVFGYDGYQTALINSYAWDTTLAWLNNSAENYSTSTSYGNYSGEIRNTGTTESDIKNNICDMAGNLREWTTEIYKKKQEDTNTNKSKNATNEIISETVNYRVVRGGSANLSRTASSHTGYKESISDNYWGFRMVLYK